jgi:squalene-hopene/tetraprenyl-beta-curcumene cyclase
VLRSFITGSEPLSEPVGESPGETSDAGAADPLAEALREAWGDGRPALPPELADQALRAVHQGATYLFSTQREDARWCAELESNPTVTAEYLFLRQMLGLGFEARQEALVRYFLGLQKEDGSWSIAPDWEGDVSTTAEVYLALRLLGVAATAPELRLAERFVLDSGGLERIRIFTRVFFACFGLVPWEAVPVIPPEFILLPPQSPLNIFRLSSWARGTMVPLFILFHHRPVFALPNGRAPENDFLDALWRDPTEKNVPYSESLPSVFWGHGPSWRLLFTLADRALRVYEPRRWSTLRKRALEKCTEYVLSHEERSGDWGGIFPPAINGVLALTLQGFGLDSEPVRRGLSALEAVSWEDEGGYRVQACVSPVWDTVLSVIALIDCGVPRDEPRLRRAMTWVLERQVTSDHGDWRIYRPALVPGGWSFEYENTWYPDVDDTAAVLLALLKQDPSSASGEPVRRGVEWTLGMQNRDGGWAAFDVDNDKVFLNQIPFSDMESLSDPSTPDVTGRVVEALGLLLEVTEGAFGVPTALRRRVARAAHRGVSYLRQTQEDAGAWFGRWGVNYLYGTSNVLCGLARAGVPQTDPMVGSALRWLRQVQAPDGGFGESLASYSDKRFMGRGEPTASQTAWGVMGLLSYLPADDPAVIRGVRWLLDRQVPAPTEWAREGGQPLPTAQGRTWEERAATGTGFPNHFYLRYHLYRHYFPMMALGRYLRAANARG